MSNEKFGRITEFIVAGKTLRTPDLEIRFEVTFDDDTEPNESRVIVYNLSDSTIAAINKAKRVVLNAGYQSGYGTILSGYITKHSTEYSESDKATTFYIRDSSPVGSTALKTIAYAKKTKSSTILRDLARRGGIGVGQLDLPKDVTYLRGTSVSGTVITAIKKIAKDCGAKAYINKGKLYVRPESKGDSSGVVISQETGMIDSPAPLSDEKVKGYNIKTALEHRITTNSLVVVKGKYVNGTMRVRSGKHISDGNSFTTEVEAVY